MSSLLPLHLLGRKISADAWYQLWKDHAQNLPADVWLPDFPSDAIQRLTNNKSGLETVEQAVDIMRHFDEQIDENLESGRKINTALDFGAGWGRLTRLLLRRIKPESLYAIDVDHRLVDAAKRDLNEINFNQIESDTKLPYADSTFDLVIANSVFSHLSESSHRFYIKEIYRVCKPGGMFLGTTLSAKHLEKWLTSPTTSDWTKNLFSNGDELEKLSTGCFVYAPTERWQNYGIAFTSRQWINDNWTDWKSIKTTEKEGAQDVTVAVK